MKNYNVKAKIKFNDTLEKATRKVGDTFKCTKERYEQLKEHNAVELINSEAFVGEDENIKPLVEPSEELKEAVKEMLEEGTKTKAKTKSKTKKK